VQIVLGILIAAVVGLALHFVLPRRGTRGVALAPLVAAAAGAVAWTALTWAGWGIDNPLLWLSALVVPAVVTVPVVLVLGAARERRDAEERARLHIG
jgi:peptidoglycan/LPS O-acetylase OafA/YrhL